MNSEDRVRVFIGSGEASLLERKVAIYSLKKNTKKPLDIYVFNGTHNSIELNDNPPVLAPMSLSIKYRNTTEFSLYRYLIPQICQYQGKAIYIDSDIVCLSDIAELFDFPTDNLDFLAKSEAYPGKEEKLWGLSVMLIDCERCRFDLETYCDEVDQGLYTLADLSRMSSRFLKYHHFDIGTLDPTWNSFDFWDSETKLIHYTDLYRQPWKSSNHPYGDLWFDYFEQAQAVGEVSSQDIELSLIRSYVRPDLMAGNSPPRPSFIGRASRSISRRLIKSLS